VTRGAGGGAASAGGTAGAGVGAAACCGAGGCAQGRGSTSIERPRALSSSFVPLALSHFGTGLGSAYLLRCSAVLSPPPSRFRSRQPIIASVTCARAAGRAPTYSIAESAEAGPDCGTAPGIARNRPDKSTSGRASCRALKRPGRDGLARRTRTRRVAITRRRVILGIESVGNRRCFCRDIEAGQHCNSQEESRKARHSGHSQASRHERHDHKAAESGSQLRVSGADLPVPASRGGPP